MNASPLSLFLPYPPSYLWRCRPFSLALFLIPCIGYVCSGAKLPILVDPELYLFYARIDFAKNRSRDAQTAETLGDSIYTRCLYQLLCDWRLPNPCVSMLVKALASNVYQKRIAEKYNLLDFFFNRPETQAEMDKTPISDFFEARFLLVASS